MPADVPRPVPREISDVPIGGASQIGGGESEASLGWIDELPAELRGMIGKLARRPDFPEQLARTSQALYNFRRRKDQLYKDLAIRAWELTPDDRRVRLAAEWAIRREVPRWHFALIRDNGRNELYERALQRFVTPRSTVLEVGAGSGILAMLAARAGAGHVYTCEAEPLLAEVAQENVERNGLGERITVIAKHSTDLVVGKDIPRPADLFVAEIVDNSLLGQNVLAVVEDAQCRLLTDDAVLLPRAVALRGCLVGGQRWHERLRAGEARGFDLSALNRLAPPTMTAPGGEHALEDELSEGLEILNFDFSRRMSFVPGQTELAVDVRRDGMAEGFLRWLHLDFGDGIEFDGKPPVESVWNPMLHAFEQPLNVSAGDSVQLVVAHDRTSVTVSLA